MTGLLNAVTVPLAELQMKMLGENTNSSRMNTASLLNL